MSDLEHTTQRWAETPHVLVDLSDDVNLRMLLKLGVLFGIFSYLGTYSRCSTMMELLLLSKGRGCCREGVLPGCQDDRTSRNQLTKDRRFKLDRGASTGSAAHYHGT